ncbi:hypothetical protein HPB49_005590 [Dermacentor silvarum]|uniref:Uncharacterized protein n=1 Tax=Dermacentor silvarum TaxID=543639 RepID=A0ACB8DNC4_DERSI|nr:hypothetical protein HPB49_005590 [Dermacentor silvarum]
MASASRQVPRGNNVLTPEYMALLKSLCKLHKPADNEIPRLFNGVFRRALGSGRARPSARAEAAAAAEAATAESPPTPRRTGSTSRDSQKRRGKFGLFCKDGGGEDPDEGDDVGYQRSCTWQPNNPCWLYNELQPWNLLLAKGCFELREHKCYELALVGFAWSMFYTPDNAEIFRTALLTHLLLRQHRCVTHVSVDLTTAGKLEYRMFWHAIENSAGGVTFIDFKDVKYHLDDTEVPVPWVFAVSAVRTLASLNLTRVFFDEDAALTLAHYLQDATALVSLSLTDLMVDERDASSFLEFLVSNKSIKKMCLRDAFLKARRGEALANVVRNHTALEELEVHGTGLTSPSALLKAAVQSSSLRCLNVYSCQASLKEINEMVNALTRRPLSPSSSEDSTSAPLTPTSRLEKLGFFYFAEGDALLERAYASLIGGVLLSLTLSFCHLKETFVAAAALKLRTDSRLQKLDVRNNEIDINGMYTLVKAMEVNNCLETLAITFIKRPPTPDVRRLFDLIRDRQLSARLNIHWEKPRGCDFAEGVLLCHASSSNMNLDFRSKEDAAALLDALASSPSTHDATIECNFIASEPVIEKLTETVGSTMYLRKLTMTIYVQEYHAVNVIEKLEGNRTIEVFELSRFLYKKKLVRALGQLVERNRVINLLTVVVEDSRDKYNEAITICNAIKDAVPRNRMYVHDAIRFVNGSSQRSHAQAFEELQHAYSLKYVLSDNYGLSEAAAVEKIAEARNRLAADYLVLTGVVSGRATSARARGRLANLGHLAGDVLARVCGFLNLNDVRNN